MRTKFRVKTGLLLLLLNSFTMVCSFGQQLPLVYDVENTGVDCTKPPLPTLSELPFIEPFTDPFEWSDRSGRSTNFDDWCRRRSEIGIEFQNYEIGPKPVRPDTITASYADNTLTVNITENGQTLTLTSQVILPEGDGPFPAVIGMGGGSGSLPSDIFTSRNIAQISFNYAQVMAWQQVRGQEPINKLYPDLKYMGAYSAWSWGVSRLIDGLELVQPDLNIDIKHLAVTGCSFAGKMALFAGAFDERIALTIPQESGGGGAAAWRASQLLGGVENLGSTSNIWFMQSMFQFAGSNVSRLPMDHHELMAMIAPRALFVIGNPSQIWLAEESGYVSCKAAQKVYETLGIPDRFGFSFVTDHGHCALPEVEKPEVGAFVEKFLLGDTTVNTDIHTHQYDYVDHLRWTYWWGTEDPIIPKRDVGGTESISLEPECATIGSNWDIISYSAASNKSYVSIKSGLNSTSQAPEDSASTIYFPFTVNSDTTFYVFTRLNCLNSNDDSYWVKLDDGPFVLSSGLVTLGWKWQKLTSFDLTAGEHTITIAASEDGAKFDKLCISSYPYFPTLKGDTADNVCEPIITTPVGLNSIESYKGYKLGENYPNPFHDKTNIPFELPNNAFVSLKLYNVLGAEIAELAGKNYPEGKHIIEFDSNNLSKGIYFYTLSADKFSESRKMIIQSE